MCPPEDDFSDWFAATKRPPQKSVPTKEEIAKAAAACQETTRRLPQRQFLTKAAGPPTHVASLGKVKRANSAPIQNIEIDSMREPAGRRAELVLMAVAILGFLRTHRNSPRAISYEDIVGPFLGQHQDKARRVAGLLRSMDKFWNREPYGIAELLWEATAPFFPAVNLPLWGFVSGWESTRKGVVRSSAYIFETAGRSRQTACEITASCFYGQIVKVPHPYDLAFQMAGGMVVIELKNREEVDLGKPPNLIEAIVLQRFADQAGKIGEVEKARIDLSRPHVGWGRPEFLPLKSGEPFRFLLSEEEISSGLPLFERVRWPKYRSF